MAKSSNAIATAIGLLLLTAGGLFLGYRIVQVPKREEVVFFVLLISFLPLLKFYSIGIYALFVVPAVIPFFRRLYYLAYTRPETDLLILIPDMLLALTFIGYLFVVMGDEEQNRRIATMKTLLVAYILYLFVRVFILNSGKTSDALLQFKFYGPFTLSFFLGVACSTNYEMIKRLGWTTIGLGVVAALYGVKQLHVGYSAAENLWFSNITFHSLFIGGLARPFSIFSSPADFADYLLIASAGLAVACSIAKSRGQKLVLLALFPLLIYGLLITSVRSSWIGAIAGILIWFIVLRKQGVKVRIAGMAILLAVFLFGSVINEFFQFSEVKKFRLHRLAQIQKQSKKDTTAMDVLVKQRLSAVTNPLKEYSMRSRFRLWQMVWKSSLADPVRGLFGRGLGTFPADSLYFTYLAEFGFTGLILLLVILILPIKWGLNIYDQLQDQRLRALARGLLTMNFVYLIINVTGSHIQKYPGDLFYWFWNGVLLKLGDLDAHFALSQDNSLPTSSDLNTFSAEST